jgi:hypothetical protein
MGDNTTMIVAAVGVACLCSSVAGGLAFAFMGDDDTTTAAAATTAAPPVNPFPSDISGISGRYTVESAEASTWKDISGKDNHVTEVKGSLKKGDGMVTGGTSDGVKFPKAVMGTGGAYTLFYVARYNGEKRGRIFDGTDGNWLSGFHGGMTGRAHHGAWMTQLTRSTHGQHAWVQGTDSKGIFRTNGVNRVTVTNDNGTSQITINHGQFTGGEVSDWAVKEVIFYDRKLTEDEIKKVEKYLKDAYMPDLPSGIKIAKGWKKDATHINTESPNSWGSPEDCRLKAKKLGHPIWAHRTEEHPANEWINRCFFYPDTDGKFTSYTDDTADTAHIMGCVDDSKDIHKGCK